MKSFPVNIAKKMLIVGGSGAGKSTFSKKLAVATGIELHHLDKYFWKAGWVETDKTEWNNKLDELLSGEQWIIEGNFKGSFRKRALCADRIFMFDLPTTKLLTGISKRYLKSKFKKEKRTDITEGCIEYFDPAFIHFVMTFNKKVRPVMFQILEEINFNKENLIIFRSRQEADAYLRTLSLPAFN